MANLPFPRKAKYCHRCNTEVPAKGLCKKCKAEDMNLAKSFRINSLHNAIMDRDSGARLERSPSPVERNITIYTWVLSSGEQVRSKDEMQCYERTYLRLVERSKKTEKLLEGWIRPEDVW